ncbi:hypothetical protein CTAYLR_008201 [Chrysophaeum taylorii]|uniref:Tetratricopeptide repeat protein n=1 Tax=Chrysophaeum taylorii TaxID=2483200 RepID=A0AAD7XM49_9STRA|nr:hypothetical protein CTAYLR_008201 [Chrysophaeum taylorii]
MKDYYLRTGQQVDANRWVVRACGAGYEVMRLPGGHREFLTFDTSRADILLRAGRHPNICGLRAVVRVDGVPCLITDFPEPREPREVAAGLAHLFDRGIFPTAQSRLRRVVVLDVVPEEESRRRWDAMGVAPTMIPSKAEPWDEAVFKGNVGVVLRREDLVRESLELGADRAIGLNNLATILEGRGQLREAKELYEEAIGIRPHPEFVRNLTCLLNGMSLLQSAKGEYESALLLRRKCLDLERRHGLPVGASLNNLGLLFAAQGRFEEAIPFCREAMAENPKMESRIETTASLLLHLGRAKEAFDLRPSLHPEALGAALAEEGDYEKAADVYTNALRENESPRLLHALALLFRRAGRDDDARPLLERALEIKRSPIVTPDHTPSK